MELKDRTVLVTGANGFVGPHLARELIASGARVVGLGLGDPRPDPPLAGWYVCDVLDAEACSAVVAATAPQAIVHLAGQASAARSFDRPVETFRANVTGAWNVLEAARRAAPGARLLFVGSGEIYGPQPEGSRAGEDTPVRPVSPYALSKAAAEALALEWAARHDLQLVATRSFGHTGPGQDSRFAVPAFAQQIAAIEAGRSDPVLRVGNLEVTRDLCDVRDVTRAYVALLVRGVNHGVYNVCRGEGARLAQVVQQLVARARTAVRVETDPSRFRPAEVPWMVGDPARIRSDTGWQPTIPLERTLGEVLDDWRRHEGA